MLASRIHNFVLSVFYYNMICLEIYCCQEILEIGKRASNFELEIASDFLEKKHIGIFGLLCKTIHRQPSPEKIVHL